MVNNNFKGLLFMILAALFFALNDTIVKFAVKEIEDNSSLFTIVFIRGMLPQATRPGISNLSRLKSISLYLRLCPPPRRRIVIRPELFLPPLFRKGVVKLFSGLSVVKSAKSGRDANREPGVTGFNCLTPITNSLFLHEGDQLLNQIQA